ncbi:DUF2809 domain-containing protein [Mangrovimonas sp. CR14]|uniref:ribosomal maturation YjgA family protein n=1 Tax=Mangrovimonas sp. CR14 TaxID=2706120 RepID=UPI00141F8DBE|nr:DUF2809 domain-containing protein [Mangrovimonas sp. CR14]NIK92331.1 DUF2809 domain-containing protein [Mangrovimonas sp. CR14]
MKLTFNLKYFMAFLVLFITEALIAYFLKSGFIRHTFGDFLIVILMYCFLKSFLIIAPKKAAFLVLVISFTIEILQYFNLNHFLGLQDSHLAKLILGSTFQWSDLLAYCLGVLFVLILESLSTKTSKS